MEAKNPQIPLFADVQDVSTLHPTAVTPSPTPPAAEPIDTEKEEFDALVKLATDELRVAKGDRRLERAALCRYFKRGGLAGYSTELLVDVLGVSSNILDGAGYRDEEAQAVMDGLGEIGDDEIAAAALD
jgi:hypothetical protein